MADQHEEKEFVRNRNNPIGIVVEVDTELLLYQFGEEEYLSEPNVDGTSEVDELTLEDYIYNPCSICGLWRIESKLVEIDTNLYACIDQCG